MLYFSRNFLAQFLLNSQFIEIKLFVNALSIFLISVRSYLCPPSYFIPDVNYFFFIILLISLLICIFPNDISLQILALSPVLYLLFYFIIINVCSFPLIFHSFCLLFFFALSIISWGGCWNHYIKPFIILFKCMYLFSFLCHTSKFDMLYFYCCQLCIFLNFALDFLLTSVFIMSKHTGIF